MLENWTTHIQSLHKCLENTEITLSPVDNEPNILSHPKLKLEPTYLKSKQGFSLWLELAQTVKHQDQTLFLIGNGASASMASHFAADLSKNAHIRSQVFTDLSQITAIANDISFEQVYATPLSRYGRKHDLLIAISSSGASKNILAAVLAAKQNGLKVVTLSAFNPDNPLRNLGNLNFYVPTQSYGSAETCHAAILHYWLDLLTNNTTSNKL